MGPVKVTVSDPKTEKVLAEQILEDDYAIITAGTCQVAHLSAHASGTHVLTVKGRKGGDRR